MVPLHRVALKYRLMLVFMHCVTGDECAAITASVRASPRLITQRRGSSNPVTVCTRTALRRLQTKAGPHLFASVLLAEWDELYGDTVDM